MKPWMVRQRMVCSSSVRTIVAGAGRRLDGSDMKGKRILIVIVHPCRPRKSNLLEVIFAEDHAPLFFCLTEHGKEHAGKDGDDSDNDQQFDEREGATWL